MKLALYGQWNGTSSLIYTFPDKLTGLPEWAESIPDPRELRELYNGNYGYSLWYNQNGYYYACTKTNTDSRNGCVMLVLLAEKCVPKDGTLLAEKMQSLLDYCLSVQDASQISYVDVSNKMKEINGLMTNRPLPADAFGDSEKVAYRIYRSQEELKLFLENPYQSSYVGYKRVLAIDESEFVMGATHTQSYTRIMEAIHRTYDIRSGSDDVYPDRETVVDGEEYVVTYKKSGHADIPVTLIAGKTNAFSTIDGNVINLKSASEAGIKFKSEVVLEVLDSETRKPIKKWSCKIDGSYKGTDIKINDDGTGVLSFDPSKSHMIEVSADGYQDKTETVKAGEYGAKQLLLQPTDESVLVSLYMEGQIYNDSVRMQSNNELYKPLKYLNKKRMALQVKQGFFSRRNLLPILGVFLVAAIAGFFGGRFSKKTTDVGNSENVDQAEQVTNLQKSVGELKKKIETLEENERIDRDLLESYQNVLVLINEKNAIDVTKVKNILAQEDFKPLMDGDMKDKGKTKEVLEKMINQLDEVVNRGGSGTPPQKTEDVKKQEDLAYFAANADLWELSAIQSEKFGRFVKSIREANIVTMIVFDGNGTTRDGYGNNNWKTICAKLTAFWNSNPNEEQKTIVKKAIKDHITNNLFDLKGLAESETLREY